MDRGCGGTGIRWAESGMEGAGSGGRGGGVSGKIRAGNLFFSNRKFREKGSLY